MLPTVRISVLAPNLSLQDNIGGLFRICDAMGVHHIYFGNPVDLGSRKLKKASRSTHKYLECTINIDPEIIIEQYLRDKHLVIGLELTESSLPIRQLNFSKNKEVLLIIGNEIQGISESLLSKIPQCYHINMYGENSSMNVIQATSIALYEIQNKI